MKKILIIENEVRVREHLAYLLTMAAYQVISADEGQKGVELAMHHTPHLILCSATLADLDGFAVLHLLKRNEVVRNCSFVLLSKEMAWPEIKKAVSLGVDDIISKPVNGSELLDTISYSIQKKETRGLNEGAGTQEKNLLKFKKTSLRELAEDRESTFVKKKETLFKEGSFPAQLYYLESGSVKEYKKNEDGKELIYNIYYPGDFFGYIPILHEERHQQFAETMEDCTIVMIPGDEFNNLIRTNVFFQKAMLKMLSENIRNHENRLLGIAYNSLRKKVAEALQSLYVKRLSTCEEGESIKMTRENLAAIAGVAKESLIRTLKDFEQEKLISLTHNTITVLECQKLRMLVN